VIGGESAPGSASAADDLDVKTVGICDHEVVFGRLPGLCEVDLPLAEVARRCREVVYS